MTSGKIRILPLDTPGLPPLSPHQENGLHNEHNCRAGLHLDHEQRCEVFGEDYGPYVGVWCTREKHSTDEVHVAHLVSANCLVVWGGE